MKKTLEDRILKEFLNEVKRQKTRNGLFVRLEYLINSKALTSRMKIKLLANALLDVRGLK